MEITLYSEFSKRRNSTKNPDSPGSISVSVIKSVTLKGNCSLIRPSFFIADVTGYAYLKAWNWYYHIVNVSYDIQGAQYIDCEIDVLGTWRNIILNTSAFVKYSTSNFNKYIKDDRIVPTASLVTTVENNFDSMILDEIHPPWYMLTCYDGNARYGISSYLLTLNELGVIIEDLINNGQSFFESITSIFTSAKDAIISVKVIPFDGNSIQLTENQTVYLGGYRTPIDTGRLVDSYKVSSGSDFLELHLPDDFRITEPYSYGKLYMPLIGVVDFSLDELQDTTKLYFQYVANISTGKISYMFWKGDPLPDTNNSKIIATYDGNFGFEIPVSYQSLNNPMSIVMSQMQAAGGLAPVFMAANAASAGTLTPILAAGAGAGALSALSSEVSGLSTTFRPTVNVIGTFAGNFNWFLCRRVKLEIYTKEVATPTDELADLYGRPCLRVLTIGTLSGYVETKGFSIDISAPITIKNMINQAMDNGVYLE